MQAAGPDSTVGQPAHASLSVVPHKDFLGFLADFSSLNPEETAL